MFIPLMLLEPPVTRKNGQTLVTNPFWPAPELSGLLGTIILVLESTFIECRHEYVHGF